MPATATHAIFAMDVYNELPNTIKQLIDKNTFQYKMFSQSTDSLMFYNIESLKSGKKVRELQHTFHTSKSRSFFITLVEYIKRNKLYDNSYVMVFLYGFICHYVLDSNVHPFVFYKTGLFDKKDKNSYKYNNLHAFMETYLDNYMIKEKLFMDPFKFRIDKFCFDNTKFNNELNKCIDYVFREVFYVDNMHKIYFDSLKQMKGFIRRYRFDKTGIKSFGYKCIDKITPKSVFRFEALSYHYKSKSEEYFLNTRHEIWFNPCDRNIFSYESFDDLYKKSILEARDIIIKLDMYFKSKKVNLCDIFLNKSYLTGLDCDKKNTLKFFYF